MNYIQDFAPIFLKPSLQEVFECLDDPQQATIFNRFIVLSPTEHYCLTTSSNVDINFATDAKVELITTCGTVLADITDKVTIRTHNNSRSGLFNITFEIVNIGQQFPAPVHLRFTQTTNPKNVFYSNPFRVLEDIQDTFRVDWRAYGVFHGVDYINAPFMQSCRFKGSFTKLDPKTQRELYLNTGSQTIQNGLIPSFSHLFTVEYQTNQELEAFQYITYSPVVWVTKGNRSYAERVTAFETASESVLGGSNFFSASFAAYVDKSQRYIPAYQITPNFMLVSFSPSGVYTPRVPTPPINIWDDTEVWDDSLTWQD